jgi:hypothetical protein
VIFTFRPLCPRKENPGTHWIRGWVCSRAGLDNTERIKFLPLPGLEFQHLCRPSRSQLLYRLRYPGSPCRPAQNKELCRVCMTCSLQSVNLNSLYAVYLAVCLTVKPNSTAGPLITKFAKTDPTVGGFHVALSVALLHNYLRYS